MGRRDQGIPNPLVEHNVYRRNEASWVVYMAPDTIFGLAVLAGGILVLTTADLIVKVPPAFVFRAPRDVQKSRRRERIILRVIATFWVIIGAVFIVIGLTSQG